MNPSASIDQGSHQYSQLQIDDTPQSQSDRTELVSSTDRSFRGRICQFLETTPGKLVVGTAILAGVGLLGAAFSIPLSLAGRGVSVCANSQPLSFTPEVTQLADTLASSVSEANLRSELQSLLAFGPRSNHPALNQSNYHAALEGIKNNLTEMGLQTYQQNFSVCFPKSPFEQPRCPQGSVDKPAPPPPNAGLNCDQADLNSCNLLTMLPGKSQRVIAVGAHLDTYHKSPLGANDNGSGVTSLIEMIRVLKEANQTFEHPILFCFWGAEEESAMGSQRFLKNDTYVDILRNLAESHNGTKDSNDPMSIQCYINLHGLGSPDSDPYGGEKEILVEHPDAGYVFPYFDHKHLDMETAEGACELSQLFIDFFGNKSTASFSPVKPQELSDHFIFNDKSIPGVHLYTVSDKCYGQPCDNSTERLDFNKVSLCTQAAIDVVTKLAMSEQGLPSYSGTGNS